MCLLFDGDRTKVPLYTEGSSQASDTQHVLLTRRETGVSAPALRIKVTHSRLTRGSQWSLERFGNGHLRRLAGEALECSAAVLDTSASADA